MDKNKYLISCFYVFVLFFFAVPHVKSLSPQGLINSISERTLDISVALDSSKNRENNEGEWHLLLQTLWKNRNGFTKKNTQIDDLFTHKTQPYLPPSQPQDSLYKSWLQQFQIKQTDQQQSQIDILFNVIDSLLLTEHRTQDVCIGIRQSLLWLEDKKNSIVYEISNDELSKQTLTIKKIGEDFYYSYKEDHLKSPKSPKSQNIFFQCIHFIKKIINKIWNKIKALINKPNQQKFKNTLRIKYISEWNHCEIEKFGELLKNKYPFSNTSINFNKSTINQSDFKMIPPDLRQKKTSINICFDEQEQAMVLVHNDANIDFVSLFRPLFQNKDIDKSHLNKNKQSPLISNKDLNASFCYMEEDHNSDQSVIHILFNSVTVHTITIPSKECFSDCAIQFLTDDTPEDLLNKQELFKNHWHKLISLMEYIVTTETLPFKFKIKILNTIALFIQETRNLDLFSTDQSFLCQLLDSQTLTAFIQRISNEKIDDQATHYLHIFKSEQPQFNKEVEHIDIYIHKDGNAESIVSPSFKNTYPNTPPSLLNRENAKPLNEMLLSQFEETFEQYSSALLERDLARHSQITAEIKKKIKEIEFNRINSLKITPAIQSIQKDFIKAFQNKLYQSKDLNEETQTLYKQYLQELQLNLHKLKMNDLIINMFNYTPEAEIEIASMLTDIDCSKSFFDMFKNDQENFIQQLETEIEKQYSLQINLLKMTPEIQSMQKDFIETCTNKLNQLKDLNQKDKAIYEEYLEKLQLNLNKIQMNDLIINMFNDSPGTETKTMSTDFDLFKNDQKKFIQQLEIEKKKQDILEKKLEQNLKNKLMDQHKALEQQLAEATQQSMNKNTEILLAKNVTLFSGNIFNGQYLADVDTNHLEHLPQKIQSLYAQENFHFMINIHSSEILDFDTNDIKEEYKEMVFLTVSIILMNYWIKTFS